jgi:hypothetical protein
MGGDCQDSFFGERGWHHFQKLTSDFSECDDSGASPSTPLQSNPHAKISPVETQNRQNHFGRHFHRAIKAALKRRKTHRDAGARHGKTLDTPIETARHE